MVSDVHQYLLMREADEPVGNLVVVGGATDVPIAPVVVGPVPVLVGCPFVVVTNGVVNEAINDGRKQLNKNSNGLNHSLWEVVVVCVVPKMESIKRNNLSSYSTMFSTDLSSSAFGLVYISETGWVDYVLHRLYRETSQQQHHQYLLVLWVLRREREQHPSC